MENEREREGRGVTESVAPDDEKYVCDVCVHMRAGGVDDGGKRDWYITLPFAQTRRPLFP